MLADPSERQIRLRCLELAVERSRVETPANFLERVAELQDKFYDLVVNLPGAKADPAPPTPQQNQGRNSGKSDKPRSVTDFM